jgi:hypothetical protein
MSIDVLVLKEKNVVSHIILAYAENSNILGLVGELGF